MLDDGRKLVGVRMPPKALPALRLHLAEALQARKMVVDGGGGGSIETTSPLDHKALVLVKTPPKNMLSYFGRAPSTANLSTPPSPFQSPSSGGKRQAGVTPQGVAVGPGSSQGGRSGRKRNKTVVAFFGKRGKGSVAEGAAALFGSHARATPPPAAAASGSAGVARGLGGGSEPEVVTLTAMNSGAPEVIAIDD